MLRINKKLHRCVRPDVREERAEREADRLDVSTEGDRAGGARQGNVEQRVVVARVDHNLEQVRR